MSVDAFYKKNNRKYIDSVIPTTTKKVSDAEIPLGGKSSLRFSYKVTFEKCKGLLYPSKKDLSLSVVNWWREIYLCLTI